MTGVPVVMRGLEDAVAHGGNMHHRHEKRHGRVLDKRKFGCAIARSTPDHIRFVDPPKLMFELTWQYCISCNMPHWILGEELSIDEIPTFNPNDHDISELEEMGYFQQFTDADGNNH